MAPNEIFVDHTRIGKKLRTYYFLRAKLFIILLQDWRPRKRRHFAEQLVYTRPVCIDTADVEVNKHTLNYNVE